MVSLHHFSSPVSVEHLSPSPVTLFLSSLLSFARSLGHALLQDLYLLLAEERMTVPEDDRANHMMLANVSTRVKSALQDVEDSAEGNITRFSKELAIAIPRLRRCLGSLAGSPPFSQTPAPAPYHAYFSVVLVHACAGLVHTFHAAPQGFAGLSLFSPLFPCWVSVLTGQ